MLIFSAITWHKLPPNPVNGILGENVTLEWNFTLNSANERLDYFVLKRHGKKMIKFSGHTGVVWYKSYKGSVGLTRNGTSSFVLINLKKNDEQKYCCEVNIKSRGSEGDYEESCTELRILGKTWRHLSFLHLLRFSFKA